MLRCVLLLCVLSLVSIAFGQTTDEFTDSTPGEITTPTPGPSDDTPTPTPLIATGPSGCTCTPDGHHDDKPEHCHAKPCSGGCGCGCQCSICTPANNLQCLEVRGIDNLDAAKLVGDWYLISGPNGQIDRGFRCAKHKWSLAPSTALGYDYRQTVIALNELTNKPTGYTKLIKTGCSASSGILSTKYNNATTWGPVNTFALVATDYTSYFVTIAGPRSFDAATLSFKTNLAARIYSRTKTLNPTLVSDLMDLIRNYIPDVSGYILAQVCATYPAYV